MKGIISIVIWVIVTLAAGSGQKTHASSQSAYQDYLYQFDVYRQMYSEFSVAKNEYLKFKTLTAQATALEKTKFMLSQRDQLLRAYLFLLNEKLNEDAGMGGYEKQLYQTLINNEVKFLDQHSKLVESIGSLEDATNISKQLESHYAIIQGSIRQTITGIALGGLTVASRQFDETLALAQTFINTNRAVYSLEKQATLDRWILQIRNKRSLHQQKTDSIIIANAQLKGDNLANIDETFSRIQKNLGEARQYLAEGSSFLTELMQALRFND